MSNQEGLFDVQKNYENALQNARKSDPIYYKAGTRIKNSYRKLALFGLIAGAIIAAKRFRKHRSDKNLLLEEKKKFAA